MADATGRPSMLHHKKISVFYQRNAWWQSGAVEACWAHNPEVRGSKPRSASNVILFSSCVRTNEKVFFHSFCFFFCFGFLKSEPVYEIFMADATVGLCYTTKKLIK